MAEIVSAWVSRYIPVHRDEGEVSGADGIRVRATGEGRFQQIIQVGRHRLFADEPESDGGLGTGPSPYDFLSVALGACTSMTVRLYAERQRWQSAPFTVDVTHGKNHAAECVGCAAGAGGMIDQFIRRITFEGHLDEVAKAKVLKIAGKCPVHRTLEARSAVVTSVGTLP